jgi:hypothetical protein
VPEFENKTALQQQATPPPAPEFRRKADDARQLMAIMEAQHQEICLSLATSRKTVEECRALLREIERLDGWHLPT